MDRCSTTSTASSTAGWASSSSCMMPVRFVPKSTSVSETSMAIQSSDLRQKINGRSQYECYGHKTY